MINLDLHILSLLAFRLHDGLSPAMERLPRERPKTKKSKKYCPVYDCNEFFTQLHKTFQMKVRHDKPFVHFNLFSLSWGHEKNNDSIRFFDHLHTIGNPTPMYNELPLETTHLQSMM